MTDFTAPAQPSKASLVKALVASCTIAAMMLVLVVLPAERNIDITGFGHAIGLTVLSEPPPEAAAQTGANVTAAAEKESEDKTEVSVPPGKGLEYKFHIRTGEKLKYAWRTDGRELFYDLHGEPKGAPKDVFESYASGTASGVEGTLTTPFEGTHGWYWMNRTTEPVKVTLVTAGAYDVLGLR